MTRREARTAAAPSSSSSRGLPKTVASGSFEVLKKLGEGCFGEVYSGRCVKTGEHVAIKFEGSSKSDLAHEVSIMKLLGDTKMPQGFTRLHYFGREGRHNCLVMERLGRSLLDLSKAAGGVFTDQSCALIAGQVLNCLELLHSRGIVHRDIKPENVLCGLGPRAHHLSLIDFGMSTTYHSNGKHALFQQVSGFSGNLRYASIGAHRLHTQSRRDDLEALGHMLYFFLLGRLPWSGLPANSWREQNRRVMEKKERTPLHEMNAGHCAAFKDYLAYCRSLGFTSRPDYNHMRGMFVKAREKIEEECGRPVKDSDVEWVPEGDRSRSEPLAPHGPVPQPEDNAAFYAPRPRGLARLCGGRPNSVAQPSLPLDLAVAVA